MPGHRHGETTYFLVGEGFVAERNLNTPTEHVFVNHLPAAAADAAGVDAGVAGVGVRAAATALDPQRAFRFSRMFDLPAFRPSPDALRELAEAMTDTPRLTNHPQLPAGFTYFGQFIDHDITFDQTAGLPDGELRPEEIIQGRSPSLDLDSLYGRGPYLETKPIYEADGVHLRVGQTTPTLDANRAFPNDLPRGHNPANAIEATIGDPRNDENLAVAQTHLAFIKFHNKVVDRLTQTTSLRGQLLFDATRDSVVKHYQWLVLRDFVARITDPVVFRDVLQNGRRFFHVDLYEEPTMPIEFSVAAFRLGHSLIRDSYEWNRVFNSRGSGGIASLGLLFVFSGGSGDLAGNPTLPSNWIVDWRRLYNFRSFRGLGTHPQLNRARRIDTALAISLQTLPGDPVNGISSLAERNLKRGRLLGLPSGQAVARAMRIRPLSAMQLRQGALGALLQRLGFDQETPLWYYILREAEIIHGGLRLGPVGSRILTETFTGLIEGSRVSILRERKWTPNLPSLTPGVFIMTNMLKFVDDLNPLG